MASSCQGMGVCALPSSITPVRKWFDIRPAVEGEPTPLFRVAVALWIAFAVALGVKAVASPIKHNSYWVFQEGTRLWWADGNMYSQTDNEFRYGPTFAVALTPIAALPLRLGALVWMALTVGACWWSLRVLLREILPCAWNADREAVFLMLTLAACYRGMWSAQSNMLILASVVAALRAIKQQRWGWAAFCLAMPVHLKIWPVAALGLLAACWPRQLAGRAVLAIVALAAVPLATRGPVTVWGHYGNWLAALSGPMQVRHCYRDAWTLWGLFDADVDARCYGVLQLSTALLALALCVWQQRRNVTLPQLLTFVLGIWCAWQLLFGPGTERNTFGLIAPVTAWAVVVAWQNQRGRGVILVAYTLTVLASIGQVERALDTSWPAIRALHPLGILLFVAWFLAHTRDWPVTAAATNRPLSGHGDGGTVGLVPAV